MKRRRYGRHPSAQALQALLEGELSYGERADLGRHLDTCAGCAAELEGWKQVFAELDELSEPPALAPSTGFAERVMAEVLSPSAHPCSERLWDYVERLLPAPRMARVGEHVRHCATCRSATVAYQAVLESLNGLERFSPTAGFPDRVIAGVSGPARPSLAARAIASLSSLLPSADRAHPHPIRLLEHVDGVLPPRRAGRVEEHLAACGECRSEVAGHVAVARALEGLERHAPAREFADRVVRAVRARASAPAAARSSVWIRGLAWARGLIPQTREAWAAISGVAVTPMVTAGLLLYAVFSHPTLTPGALVSFAAWKLSALLDAAVSAVGATVVESVPIFKVLTLLQFFAQEPFAVAGGLLLLSTLTVAAAWILYRNLVASRPVDGTYAHGMV